MQPGEGDGADPLALLPDPRGRGQVVERLDEAGLLAAVRGEVGAAVTLGASGALPLPGPGAEAVEVRGAEAARGPREQPHQPVAARGVLDDVEERDEVGDLRGVQQPPQADDLVGQTGPVEGLDDRVELRTLAAQDRRGAPPRTP